MPIGSKLVQLLADFLAVQQGCWPFFGGQACISLQTDLAGFDKPAQGTANTQTRKPYKAPEGLMKPLRALKGP